MMRYLIFLFLPIFGFGQSMFKPKVEFGFSNYQSISDSAGTLNNKEWSDLSQYNTPLGFAFTWEGYEYDSILVQGRGTLYFTQKCKNNSSSWPVLRLDAEIADLGFYQSGDSSITPIYFHTYGSEGAKKTVLEWKNVTTTFYELDTVNFQIIFDESDNSITYHFGKIITDDWGELNLLNSGPPSFLIAGNVNNCSDFSESTITSIYQENDSFKIVIQNVFDFLPDVYTIEKKPESGFFWKIKLEETISVEENAQRKNCSIFPNPTTENFTLKIANQTAVKKVLLLDGLGKKIDFLQYLNGFYSFGSNLSKGFYFVKVIYKDGASITQKIVKY